MTALCGLGALSSLVVAIAFASLHDWLDAAVAPGGIAFCLSLQWLWRRTKNAALIGNVFGVCVSALYFSAFLYHREVAMMAWLSVMPLLVLFLGGRKLGAVWLGIEIVLLFTAMAIVAYGPRVPVDPSRTEPSLMLMGALMVMVFAVGLIFDVSTWSVLNRLREANEMKGRFLANVSHELRTPLNGVLGMAELMAEHELPNAQRERLSVLLQSGHHLRQLIQDVLDVTRLERTSLKVSDAPVLPAEAARNAISQLESLAQAKKLSLALEVHGEPIGLRSDGLRLMQIVTNLTGNALKFTDEGGVTVIVVTTALPNDQVRLVIEVRDTGPGISPEDLGKLFVPFARLDKDANTAGTGLGLSIVKTIAELLGGSVSVRSKVGEGSTFRFEMERPRAEMAAPQQVVNEPSPIKPPRVMLVDDNAINRKVARGMLEKLGCEVVTAADGAAALAVFAPGQFDLVLMDLHMPVMDGFEASREMRLRDPEVRIIALTATTVTEELDSVRSYGMNGHLEKPVRLDQLRSELRAVGEPPEIKSAS